jgi:hypothetical protein
MSKSLKRSDLHDEGLENPTYTDLQRPVNACLAICFEPDDSLPAPWLHSGRQEEGTPRVSVRVEGFAAYLALAY